MSFEFIFMKNFEFSSAQIRTIYKIFRKYDTSYGVTMDKANL